MTRLRGRYTYTPSVARAHGDRTGDAFDGTMDGIGDATTRRTDVLAHTKNPGVGVLCHGYGPRVGPMGEA